MSHNITVKGGTSVRLPTAGKYCDRDIVVTAEGGGGNTGGEGWIGDGNTHIWISLQEGRTSPMLSVCPKGTVTVDWGDGTTPDVLTGTNTSVVKYTPNHEYAKAGDYVITLNVDGEMGFYSGSTNGNNAAILRYSSNSDTRNTVYKNAIKKVEIGNGITKVGNYAFSECYSLASIVIPDGVTSIGTQVFNSCGTLVSIVIPNSVTSIGNSAFNTCNSLPSIVIPNSVTSIGSSAFAGCTGVRFYDFTNHTAVPTLSNTDAFTNIPSDCEILVPSALYDEWIAATNWTTYASKIVAV